MKTELSFHTVLGIDFFEKYDLFLAVREKRRGIALLEKQ